MLVVAVGTDHTRPSASLSLPLSLPLSARHFFFPFFFESGSNFIFKSTSAGRAKREGGREGERQTDRERERQRGAGRSQSLFHYFSPSLLPSLPPSLSPTLLTQRTLLTSGERRQQILVSLYQRLSFLLQSTHLHVRRLAPLHQLPGRVEEDAAAADTAAAGAGAGPGEMVEARAVLSRTDAVHGQQKGDTADEGSEMGARAQRRCGRYRIRMEVLRIQW